MSMSPDEVMESGTSYGDFRHETIEVATNENSGIEGQNGFGNVQFNPLSDTGGIDNDEIAELVGFYATVTLSRDPTATGETGGLYEFRGVFGANLNDQDITGGPPADTEGDPLVNSIIQQDLVNENGVIDVNTVEEQGVFLQWDVTAGPDGETVTYERYLRDTYGRGPVLDATDDINFVLGVIRQDGTTTSVECTIQLHLIWDVAVVEGVRNRFSLPEGFR